MKCFEYNNNYGNKCNKEKCRYWIDQQKFKNCCIIAAKKEEDINEEKFTLQDIGNIFNVTRMRICQIEKNAISKLKSNIGDL